jgi:hypothetical protein
MYILVKETIPLGLAMAAVAHASLACFRKFEHTIQMQDWLNSFKKVICIVSKEEFESAKSFNWNVVLTESALNGEETAIAFLPRENWPKEFRTYRLYR